MKIASPTLVSGALLIHVWCSASPAAGMTINVGPGGAFTHIQEAITAAAAGDTILVSSGTYVENLDFSGKSLALISASGASATSIDGSSADDAVIKVFDCFPGASRVEGFTITGGRGAGGPPSGDPKSGGGIAIFNSEVVISSNWITGNTAKDPRSPTEVGDGGGIYCGGTHGHAIVVVGNRVFDNQAAGNGGGISAIGSVVMQIEDNEIYDNRCAFGDGGGVRVLTQIDGAIVRNNIIRNNFAGDHGGGVYLASFVFQRNFEFLLSGNEITGNTATSRSVTNDAGGGCYLFDMDGSVSSNTIVDNLTGSSQPPDGSGIAIQDGGHVTLRFNLLALNQPGAALACFPSVTVSIADNLFWGNLPADVSGSPCAEQAASNNLFTDPQFCNAEAGIYSLAASSPALNYPAGPIGAIPDAGCPGVAIVATTWSGIKAFWNHPTAINRLGPLGRETPARSLPIITLLQ